MTESERIFLLDYLLDVTIVERDARGLLGLETLKKELPILLKKYYPQLSSFDCMDIPNTFFRIAGPHIAAYSLNNRFIPLQNHPTYREELRNYILQSEDAWYFHATQQRLNIAEKIDKILATIQRIDDKLDGRLGTQVNRLDTKLTAILTKTQHH